jgi:acetoin utilization protein AcuB
VKHQARIKELMQSEVFTVGPDDMVDRVFFLLHYEKIRHLPVIERGKVVGIVSDRDLYKALGPRGRRRVTSGEPGKTSLYVMPRRVRHVMRRGVITIDPEAEATKAAAIMARRRIGALPVVRNDKLVGIITSTDLLREYARLGRARPAAPPSGTRGAS